MHNELSWTHFKGRLALLTHSTCDGDRIRIFKYGTADGCVLILKHLILAFQLFLLLMDILASDELHLFLSRISHQLERGETLRTNITIHYVGLATDIGIE